MKQTKIVFFQTAHAADDDRVWYHQAMSLANEDFNVHVLANNSNFIKNECITIVDTSNKKISEKLDLYTSALEILAPDIVVCDTPFALKCVNNLKKRGKKIKTIYDVTEWYPSKKNFLGLNPIKKIFKSIFLALLNFTVNFKTDGFIFGEVDKAKPFRILFPRKPYIYLSYYPDLQYIDSKCLSDFNDRVKLFYAGDLSEEKGFNNVIEVAKLLAKRYDNQQFVLNVVTNDNFENYLLQPNLEIIFHKYMPLKEFCSVAANNDFFLDLRKVDFENSRCLPIKLFYYMAMQRPVIYSDLLAIRKGCPEVFQFGYLVAPTDYNNIVDVIGEYINTPEKYRVHCDNARKYSEEKYNWGAIKDGFIKFVESL